MRRRPGVGEDQMPEINKDSRQLLRIEESYLLTLVGCAHRSAASINYALITFTKDGSLRLVIQRKNNAMRARILAAVAALSLAAPLGHAEAGTLTFDFSYSGSSNVLGTPV